MDVAIDTSTVMQSVAVGREGVVVEQLVYHRKQHSRGLAESVQHALARHGATFDDVRAYVVGLGPGSFTGLRVSLSLVKGLCAGSGARAIGVSSLRATPCSLPPGSTCAVAWDAYKHLVYAALYETGPMGRERIAPLVESPEAFAERLSEHGSPLIASGNGFARYSDAFAGVSGRLNTVADLEPNAGGLLRYAYATDAPPCDASKLEPMYLRRSAAEEARDARASKGDRA